MYGYRFPDDVINNMATSLTAGGKLQFLPKNRYFAHFQVIITKKINIENHYHRANEHCCQWGILAAEVSSRNHR